MPVNSSSRPPKTDRSHAPENSLLFEKVVPVLLIVMGIIMVTLILFAAGVLLGIIRF
jgi:hypothetical protein